MWKPTSQKCSCQQVVYWGFTLIAATGAFFIMRSLTACWQLTALPGVLPSYCAAESINPPNLPDPVHTGLSGEPISSEVSLRSNLCRSFPYKSNGPY
jgi:hypothetical protein